jgi:hypothetical protein
LFRPIIELCGRNEGEDLKFENLVIGEIRGDFFSAL